MRERNNRDRKRRIRHDLPDRVSARYSINNILIEEKEAGGGNHEE